MQAAPTAGIVAASGDMRRVCSTAAAAKVLRARWRPISGVAVPVGGKRKHRGGMGAACRGDT